MRDAALFVCSGILSTLLQQALLSAGAADAWTALLPFVNYAGMSLLTVGQSGAARAAAAPSPPPPPSPPDGARLSAVVWACVLLDISGFLLAAGAISAAGSGLYQVLYSSVVIFAALASWAVRRRSLSPRQVAGVALVIVGTALTARGGGAGALGAPPTPRVLGGMALSVAAAAVYGCVYGLAELSSSLPGYPGPHALAARIGRGVVALLAGYIALAVLPRAHLIAARIAQAGLMRPRGVLAAYCALAASSAVHSLAYFHLVAARGATATGVMASLRAVGVFALSAPLFCATQPAACWSWPRAAASAVVVGGVLVFSSGSPSAEEGKGGGKGGPGGGGKGREGDV